MKKDKFWINKKLTELSHSEWEALCDNCGKCCVIKLQNEKNNEVFYTNISCKLLNTENCKCMNYSNRKKIVPDCVKLTPKNLSQLNWMPNTCAYKLVIEGKKLPSWHPLMQEEYDKKTHYHGNHISIYNGSDKVHLYLHHDSTKNEEEYTLLLQPTANSYPVHYKIQFCSYWKSQS